MKHTKTYPLLIFAIVTMLATLSVFIVVFRSIKHKNEHAYAVSEILSEKMFQKENFDKLQNVVNENKEQREKISSFLVDTTKIDEFVGMLEDLGAKVGTDLTVGSVEVPKGKKNLVSIDLSSKGSFNNIMKLVVLLQNIPYETSVNKVYLNKNSDGNLDPKTGKVDHSKDYWELQFSFNVITK